MGLSPIKILKNFHKNKNPNPVFKNPQFLKSKLKSAKFKTKVKTMFRKTYLEVILQRFLLENDGVWVKRDFGLRGVRERQCEGKTKCLKNCHICYIKLKTRVFCGLGSRNISRETHWSFRKKLLVAKQSRDSCDGLYMKLKIFQFFPKTIPREEFSREILTRQ